MLDISQLSRQSGFPASKLRYYEEVGLISSVGRKGLKRLYEDEVKTRLAIISLGKIAGFSLTEIRNLIGSEGRPDLNHDVLRQKADEIDRQIKQLRSLSEGVRHIANCSAPNHLDCPRFQRIMGVALKKARKAGDS